MQTGSTPQVQDYYKDLSTPSVDEMALQLEQLVQQGTLSPEQAQTFLLEQSAMEDVSQDPATRQAQMDALGGLQEIVDNKGLTATDRANLNKIATEEATQERGAREAILSNAAERGVSGSGLELLSQMKAQQDAAGRRSQRDMDVAAMAEQRALQALMNQGELAGQIGNQQFTQDASKAGAQDAISKFNAQARQSTEAANVAARNDAQAKNLAVKQGVADSNVALKNQQQQYNKELQQREYENRLKKAGGQTEVAAKNSDIQGANSKAEADAFNKTLGTGLTMGSYFLSDERTKEGIEDFDSSEFLDTLVPRRFKYKDAAKMGSGTHGGVMAQDLEKTDEGSSAVVDGPHGKMVDSGKATSLALASLAGMHKRLKKLEGEE